METVFQELTMGCQHRYNSLRRRTQFFSTFAGGVIEALRESGFRLSNFRRQAPYAGFSSLQAQGAAGAQAGARIARAVGGETNIGLEFEQRDRDRCQVFIIPYRTDLPFLSKGHFYCQIGLELSRYSSDPDVLRQALDANSRSRAGSFLGGSRLPKLTLSSPPALQRPGTMTFELQGARLVVAMNVIMDLAKYRQSDFDLDIGAIREDFQALFYGLEKYLSLLLESMGGGVEVVPEESSADAPVPSQTPAAQQTPPVAPAQPEAPAPPVAPAPTEAPPPPASAAIPPPSATVPLQAAEAPAEALPSVEHASTQRLSMAELEAQTEREKHKSTLRVTRDEVQAQLNQIEDTSSTMRMSTQEVQEKLSQIDDTSSTMRMTAQEVQDKLSQIDDVSSTMALSADEIQKQITAIDSGKHRSPFGEEKED